MKHSKKTFYFFAGYGVPNTVLPCRVGDNGGAVIGLAWHLSVYLRPAPSSDGNPDSL
ncbi:hypothetical protein BLL52_1762 [Rhodoferax antarcticus ANT.BR]|uniref:Uncharacterized protein n=1 Tax=Rhodoferax antarcticus ANT.BR TaxID=1111071 RepID=A0A1Q8YG36_9BURK|nr:hypothetical protein BLL52_1762 [Rhodoferax antarcticus ANT.BR]